MRQNLIKKRKALSKKQHQKKSLQICNKVLQKIKKKKRVALFLPIQAEVNLYPLIAQLLAQNVKVYLPFVLQKKMFFNQLKANSHINFYQKLKVHQISNGSFCFKKQLDWVITPVLCINKKGFRMGYGGGFYDKAFAWQQNSQYTKPKLLAPIFELQKQDFKEKPWDIKVHYAVSEKQCYYFK